MLCCSAALLGFKLNVVYLVIHIIKYLAIPVLLGRQVCPLQGTGSVSNRCSSADSRRGDLRCENITVAFAGTICQRCWEGVVITNSLAGQLWDFWEDLLLQTLERSEIFTVSRPASFSLRKPKCKEDALWAKKRKKWSCLPGGVVYRNMPRFLRKLGGHVSRSQRCSATIRSLQRMGPDSQPNSA